MLNSDIIDRLKKLEKKLGRRPVKRDSSALYFHSRKRFGSWNNMMVKAGYKCKNKQKPIIPKKFSKELYYLLGLISTDGHLQEKTKDKNCHKVLIYTSEKEEVEIILKLVNLIFGYNCSIRERNTEFSKRINYEIYVSSKEVVLFLNNLGIPLGAKSHNLKVPKIINKSNKNSFWHYFRGVFDGDGSVIFSKKNSVFKIYSGSMAFLEGLKKILSINGFNNFKISNNGGRNSSNTFVLRTNMKDDIERLFSLIYEGSEFYYPRKKRKWAKQYI